MLKWADGILLLTFVDRNLGGCYLEGSREEEEVEK